MIKKLLYLIVAGIFFSMYAFGVSLENISDIEYSKYGRSYENESLSQRLNRLETDYFGLSQTGDLSKRLANLERINANQKNGIAMPSSIYDTKPKSKLRQFWDNLTSDGYMTGYTPSILNTTSSSGFYPDDLYNNNLYNNMSNFPSYCPYNRYNNFNNRYPHRNHRYYERRFNGVNRFTPNAIVPPNHYGYFNPYYNQRPYSRTTYYTPPNIETKSSVHILKD